MSDLNVGVIADYVTSAAEPMPLGETNDFFSVVVPQNGTHKIIDVASFTDKYAANPRRKTGTVAVHDAATFIAYLTKHATPETEVWADLDRQALVAVINAHGPANDVGLPGHGDFRARLALTHPPAWQAWTALDGKLLSQVEFAEHIEHRVIDIRVPSGADMLEIAQTFTAKREISFESSKSLSTGQTQFEYRETIDGKAGKNRMEIPKEFELGLVPFTGGPGYKVMARLRYRIADGSLRIGYVLDRPAEVLSLAFADLLEQVEVGVKELGVAVFRGTPA